MNHPLQIMKGLRYFLIVFVLLLFQNTNAADGCLVNSNIYSNPAPTALNVNLFSDLKMYTSPGQSTSCFSGTVSSSTACYVCDQGGEISSAVSIGSLLYLITCNKKTNALGLGPYYSALPGTYYSSYVLQCNLDDYSWALGSVAAACAFIIIRRKRNY